MLTDDQKRQIVDLGGDPLAPGGGMGPGPAGGGGPFVGFQDIMDAFFGTAGGGARGPRPRTRPGSDAILPLPLELHETAFGVEAPITVDTAVLCQTCHGGGTAPGTHPSTCDVCGGRGEVQSVQRTFLGQVISSRPCNNCGGYGTVIANPCPTCAGDGRVRTRRTLTVKIPPGVSDGLRIRHSGEGEVGPGGGPPGDLYVEIHEKPHPVFKVGPIACDRNTSVECAVWANEITLSDQRSFTVHNVEGHAMDYPYLVYAQSPSGQGQILKSGTVSIDNGAYHPLHALRVFQKSRSGSFSRNILYPAAAIDVDKIGIGGLGN